MAKKSKNDEVGELQVTISNGDTAQSPAIVLSSDNVLDNLEQLKAKKAELANIQNTEYRTTSVLKGFGVISEMTELSKLIQAYHSIVIRNEGYTQAIEDLGLQDLEIEVLKIGGHSADAWIHDIKARIDIIRYEDKVDALHGAIKILEKHLSEKDKLTRDFQNIQDLLKQAF